MKIEDLIKISKQYKLSAKQIVFLYCEQENIEPPEELAPEEVGELKLKGFYKDDQVTDFWITSIRKRVIREVKFKVAEELTPIIMYISKTLITHSLTSYVARKLKEDFLNNQQLGVMYYTWMCLFPTLPGSKENKGWEELFAVNYTGVRIRKYSSRMARNFLFMARKKDVDMGLYIIGTYLFIQNHIHGAKTYIPTMSKFIEEQIDWYETAEALYEEEGLKGVEMKVQVPYFYNYRKEFVSVYEQLFILLGKPIIDKSLLPAVNNEFSGKPELLKAYLTWMGLLPGKEKAENKAWEFFYSVPYTGNDKRDFSKKRIAEFKELMHKEDFALDDFLIGTFLFVRSHIQQGKMFLPNLDKFMEEKENWMSRAHEMMEGKTTEQIRDIFKYNEDQKTETTGVNIKMPGATII